MLKHTQVETQIKTTVKPFDIKTKASVAVKWRALEENAEASVFLSWHWINQWLSIVTGKLFLVECISDNSIIGLGFFVETERKVFGLYSVKQWWLHRTGVTKLDQIWIEHNDFLLDKRFEDKARANIIQTLFHYDASVKEFVIGLSSPKVLADFQKLFPHVENLIDTIGYIAQSKSPEDNYLQDVLSKNTRSQINRSKKILKEQGNFSFKVITQQQQVLALLPNIAKVHIKLWQHDLSGSGFSNENFTEFHQALIKAGNNVDGSLENIVQIAVLSIDNVDLGYLVNFVYNNKVYFYLSALAKSHDSKIKVGLTLHSEAVQYYSKQGILSYDFLGGEARYKQSLSNTSYQLALACFYQDNTILKLERSLKKIKQKLINN